MIFRPLEINAHTKYSDQFACTMQKVVKGESTAFPPISLDNCFLHHSTYFEA